MTVLYQYTQFPDWYIVGLIISIVAAAVSLCVATDVKKLSSKVISLSLAVVLATSAIAMAIFVKQDTYIYATFEDIGCYEDFSNHYTFFQQKGDLYILKLTEE